MSLRLAFAPGDVTPATGAVLEQLGMPAGSVVPERLAPLYGQAADLFADRAAPAGLIADIPSDRFAEVYEGEGRNAARSPVPRIAAGAEHLALFAVTLGTGVSDTLARCFAERDFALASILDAMASVAADGAADLAERRYEDLLRAQGWGTLDAAVLRYSPGYCGWDVTGQRTLFAYLEPAAIGLTLTGSCLMRPLKSVSGVLIAGPRAIHRFPPDYPFCDACETRTCRDRLRELYARTAVKSEK